MGVFFNIISVIVINNVICQELIPALITDASPNYTKVDAESRTHYGRQSFNNPMTFQQPGFYPGRIPSYPGILYGGYGQQPQLMNQLVQPVMYPIMYPGQIQPAMGFYQPQVAQQTMVNQQSVQTGTLGVNNVAMTGGFVPGMNSIVPGMTPWGNYQYGPQANALYNSFSNLYQNGAFSSVRSMGQQGQIETNFNGTVLILSELLGQIGELCLEKLLCDVNSNPLYFGRFHGTVEHFMNTLNTISSQSNNQLPQNLLRYAMAYEFGFGKSPGSCQRAYDCPTPVTALKHHLERMNSV